MAACSKQLDKSPDKLQSALGDLVCTGPRTFLMERPCPKVTQATWSSLRTLRFP